MQKKINKGLGTQPKYDRNVEMIERYKDGVPMLTLQIDYGISSSRIHKIRRAMGVPANTPHRKPSKSKK